MISMGFPPDNVYGHFLFNPCLQFRYFSAILPSEELPLPSRFPLRTIHPVQTHKRSTPPLPHPITLSTPNIRSFTHPETPYTGRPECHQPPPKTAHITPDEIQTHSPPSSPSFQERTTAPYTSSTTRFTLNKPHFTVS